MVHFSRWGVAVIWLLGSLVALADVSGTVILESNTALDADNGVTSTSGADILWNGTTVAPQAGALAYSFGPIGLNNWTNQAESDLANLQPSASSAAIPATRLTPGYAFFVVTTAGNLAKALVTANSGGAITLIYYTYRATPAANVPVVYQILNNSSGTPPLYPNYGIAPSSIFIVTGSGLSDPGTPALQSSAAPGIPSSLNGTSISVTVGGVTTHPALYYTSPGQIAAVLPAATPVGTGVLTVTYRGVTSVASPIQVVPSAVGINFYGVNTAVATDNATGALITLTNSAVPNETLTLWTTGLGADAADSDTVFSAAPHVVSTPLQIYLGGVSVPIVYQGSSGYPGVTQIDITLPASPPLGCWVSLVAVTGAIISNATTLPVNSTGGACLDQVTGLNGTELSPVTEKNYRAGLVSLVQSNTALSNGTRSISNDTDGSFESYSGFYNPGRTLSPGGCTVGPAVANVPGPVTGLSVGTITLTGPNSLSVKLGPQLGITGAFETLLSSTAIPSTGGTFTYTGSGGSDVGAFTATVTFTNPVLTASGVVNTVTRSAGLPVSWTGGNPGTYVYVMGTSTSTPLKALVGFSCLVPVDAGTFTVPPYILLGVPAGTGGVNLQTNVYSNFTASGLDTGLALGNVNYSAGSTTFQ
jgi:uncharacterized protein (TIGR03437 family)